MIGWESRSVSRDGKYGWNHRGKVFSNVSGHAGYAVEDGLDFEKEREAAAIDHAPYILVFGCVGRYRKWYPDDKEKWDDSKIKGGPRQISSLI